MSVELIDRFDVVDDFDRRYALIRLHHEVGGGDDYGRGGRRDLAARSAIHAKLSAIRVSSTRVLSAGLAVSIRAPRSKTRGKSAG